MLSPEEKAFFIRTALGASLLSGCDIKQGALLVRDRKILSYGFNRKIDANGRWPINAVYDAIFGASSDQLQGSTLFCTYFPTLDEFKMLVAIGVSSINFSAEITKADSETIHFINDIANTYPFEIIQLQP